MPKEWYLMTRPLFNSGAESDEMAAFGIDGFQEILESFLGKDVLIYDRTPEAEPRRCRAVIQNVTTDSANLAAIRQILCGIGTLKCGQYVVYDDMWWLVATLPDNNGVYEKAVLWKCQVTLRFLSPLTGGLVWYPVYDQNSTQYGTGLSIKQHMTVGEAEHMVYLPYNEETILLDDDFRFLMDRNRQNPTAYKITQVDSTSNAVGEDDKSGLIRLSLIETQFNAETDSKELMIADYYSKSIGDAMSEQGESGYLVLTDQDGDQRLAVGEEKEIRVSYRRDDGTDAPVLEYTVSLEPDDGAVEIVSQKDDAIILRARHDRALVGRTVALCVSCVPLDTSARLAIQIVNW